MKPKHILSVATFLIALALILTIVSCSPPHQERNSNYAAYVSGTIILVCFILAIRNRSGGKCDNHNEDPGDITIEDIMNQF